jgi:predicted amidohydrolase
VAYAGASMIVSPRGEMLALAGPEPQLLIAEIDRAPLVEYRRDFPALADMRTDLVR